MVMLPDIDTYVEPVKDEVLPTRLGTPIEHGSYLSQDRMERIKFQMAKKWEFYSAYPDLWVEELLIPEGSSFELKFYQRIFMRSAVRHSMVHITGARGTSKTFIIFLVLLHQAIFKPNSVWGFAAPNKAQSAKIATQTYSDIMARFPILKMEILGERPIAGKDYFELRFKNGSKILITVALDSTRGLRLDGVAIDESRDQDGEMVNAILIPTLTKVRRTAGRELLNPYETQQIQIYTTSASSKSSYNYEKVIDTLIRGIITPNDAMVIGLDYTVPVAEGIYPASFVQSARADKTMGEEDFAREYLSLYTQENADSWFDFSKINRHRKLVRAEWEYTESPSEKRVFYTISCDVGRFNDNTAVHIYKNYQGDGKIRTKLVNTLILGRTAKEKPFDKQAMELKRLIQLFKAEDVIIDTNGLGVGLADQMIKEQVDEQGNVYPAYGFHNDKEYQKVQPMNAAPILYSFKANANLNSEIFSNCYTRIDSGLVDFLITEQKAKVKLLGTKEGSKMTLEQRTAALMPFEMTSKLMEEMGNQRLRRTSGTKISLEPINARFPDDRFSSLCLGLYRIKQLEEQITKRRRRGKVERMLTFYTGR